MKVFQRCTVLLLFAGMLWLPCEAKNIAVVVSKSNNTGSITSADLAKMLESTARKWPDGSNVTVVLPGGATSQDAELVVARVFKLNQAQARKFLADHKSVFVTGSSDEDVLNKVGSLPGSVGLVDVYSINNAVRVLKVDGKLPLEQGYLLR
jgi:ABC-type phosphate transport system substrate-binding protein